VNFLDETPECPIILHFGERDPTIPLSDVDRITDAHPKLRVFTYDAGHGFFSDRRQDYAPEAAAVAWRRTLRFFDKHARAARNDLRRL
jgi:carboxymethylenebutenolidase